MIDEATVVAKTLRMEQRKPTHFSMCGDTGRFCIKMQQCAMSYLNSGWFLDEFGNQCRTIEGGGCVRESLPPINPEKPRRKIGRGRSQW